MDTQQEETSKGEDTSCVPPFDCYSQKLIELNLKWDVVPSQVTVTPIQKQFLAPNPFRIYLRIAFASGSQCAVGTTGQSLGTGGGEQLANTHDFLEYSIQLQGPMSMQGWSGKSVGSTNLQVYEGIWKGNTRKDCVKRECK